MTQEDKELLFKDLCARFPYGVKIQYDNQPCKLVVINDDYTVLLLGEDGHKPNIEDDLFLDIEKAKPYLRPMSSMTEEEDKEYTNIDNRSYSCPKDYAHIPAQERIDWLNAHHFDYRNLIKKCLAIEVTKENNPYESTNKAH